MSRGSQDSLSTQERDRVLKAIVNGERAKIVAREINCEVGTIYKWKSKLRGLIELPVKRGRRPKIRRNRA